MVVVLSREDGHDFGEMDGYVCDWENRREMRFLDYLGEITREITNRMRGMKWKNNQCNVKKQGGSAIIDKISRKTERMWIYLCTYDIMI